MEDIAIPRSDQVIEGRVVSYTISGMTGISLFEGVESLKYAGIEVQNADKVRIMKNGDVHLEQVKGLKLSGLEVQDVDKALIKEDGTVELKEVRELHFDKLVVKDAAEVLITGDGTVELKQFRELKFDDLEVQDAAEVLMMKDGTIKLKDVKNFSYLGIVGNAYFVTITSRARRKELRVAEYLMLGGVHTQPDGHSVVHNDMEHLLPWVGSQHFIRFEKNGIWFTAERGAEPEERLCRRRRQPPSGGN